MKKYIYLLLIPLITACSADDASIETEEVTLFVNHFKTTSVLNGTSFVIQENEAIGTADFQSTPFINGFEFESGKTYLLNANRVTTKNAGTNATTTDYEFISLIEESTVPLQTEFTIPIARFINGIGHVNWIRGNPESGFVLGGDIQLECNGFCSQLEDLTLGEGEMILTGVFVHGEEGIYRLVELN